MKKKKIRRWILGVVGGLLLLLLLLQATFLLFGDEILKNSILLGFRQYSQQAFEPGREPELDFDNLSLNILTGNLTLEGLYFAGYLPSEEGSGDYLRLSVPQATVEGLKLLDLYKERSVVLEDINFINPDIQLMKSADDDSLRMAPQESIRASTRSLHRLIVPYLRTFSFRKLNVRDGNLFVTQQGEDTTSSNRFLARHVYIDLNDFLLDSLSLEKTDRIFFTKDFEVRLGDYQILAPDSSFLLRSDTLGYSSREETIYLKNVRTFPLQQDSLKTNFSLSVPDLYLTEVSWKEIYFDSLFYADQLVVEQPMLSLSNHDKADSLKNQSQFALKHFSVARLYPLISDKFKELRVNDLVIRQGRLHMEQVALDTVDLMSIHEVNFLLKGIRLGAGAGLQDSLTSAFPADTFILDLQDIRMYLPDRRHYLTIANASLNTSRQQDFVCNVLLDSLNLKPGYDSLEQLLSLPPVNPLAFEIFIPRLRLDGIQLEDFNQNRLAVLDSIYIHKPDVRIANFGPLSLGKQASGLSKTILDTLSTEETVRSILYDWSHARLNLSPFIAPGDSSAFLQGLYATKLQLDSGILQVVKADTQQYALIPVTSVDTLYTFLQNIKIDHLPNDSLIVSDSGRVAVMADEVDVFIQNGAFVLPGEGGAGGTFRVEDARVSTLEQQVYLRNVYYWTSPGYPPGTDFWLHNMYIPYVQLKEVALQKLYQEQVAEAKSFSAWKPRFTFNYRKSGITRPKVSFDFEDLYPQFSSYLQRIDLGMVSMNDAELTVRKINRGKIDSLFLTEKLNLDLRRFYIDSLTKMSKMRPFYAYSLDLRLDNYRWNFLSDDAEKQLQGMAGKSLQYNSYEGQLDALELRMLVNTASDPLLEKLTLRSHKIIADDIDPYRLIRDQNLHIGRLIVQQPFFELAEREGRGSDETSDDEQWSSLQPDMNQLLSRHLKKIDLRFVHVEEGMLTYLKRSNTDTLNFVRLDSVDFLARNILVNGKRDRHLNNVLYADDVDYTVISGKLLFNQPGKQRIEIDKAGLSSRDSRMYLQGIRVHAAESLIDDKNASHIEAEAERLSFNGLDLNRAYLYGALNIRQVLPRRAKLKVFFSNKQKKEETDTPVMREILSPYIRSIEVDQIQLPRTELRLVDKKEGEEIFGTQQLTATISGFSLNQELLAQQATTATRAFYARDVSLIIQDYARETTDGMYRLQADEINIGTASRSVGLLNFKMQPLLSRQEVLGRFDHATSLATIASDQVSFEGLDFEKLFNHKEWHVQQLDINRPVLEVYREKRLPHDESRRVPPLQKMLFGLDQQIKIDKVAISDGLISYAERSPEANEDGVIDFEQVNVEVQNITNHSQALNSTAPMKMEVDARVMGEGQLNAAFQFATDTTDMDFSVIGTLGPMQLSHFNKILEPAAYVHIKEGKNQNMQFSFSGNQHKATGTMEFRYDDLSVLMIDKEKGQAGFDEKLGSFIANAFVLKASNPKSVFLRIGNIECERDPSRAMVNYWWKSILSGVKSSIGLDKNTEKTKDFVRKDGS